MVFGIGLYFLCSGADSFRIGAIGSILKLIALVPLTLAVLDIRNWRLRISFTLVAQMLFWLMSLVSVFYSLSPERSLKSVQSLTLNLALILILGVMEQHTEEECRFLQRSLLAGSWLCILMLLLFSDRSVDGRLTLLLGKDDQDQNYINGYFMYAFSWHLSRLILMRKNWHMIPVGFILYIQLLSGSRGSLVAFLLVIFIHTCILFAQSAHTLRNILVTALFLMVLLLLFDQMLKFMPQQVALRYSWDYLAEKGTTGRTRIWKFLLEHYSGDSILRMLFGHGYATCFLVNTLKTTVAHNLYLDNLITLGIFGLLLQLAVQGSILYILHKRKNYPLLATYYGMIGMCMSLSLVNFKPIWNIMLLTLALDGQKKSKARDSFHAEAGNLKGKAGIS